MSVNGAYGVGIDIGTTHTAAAVWRYGRAMSVPLGGRSHSVPSVLYLREDGTMLVGEAAVQRGIMDTDRVVREFKRRFGDTVPIMLGERQFTAEDLTGELLSWVLRMVAEREGRPPAHVTLTHPAIWRTYRRDLLVTAARRAGLPDVGLLPEPVAAAAYYASTERLDTDALLAVYDLGGGTFDATVVRKTPNGFAIQGAPSGDDNLGGIDFDQAVMDHVTANLGSAWTSLDLKDPAVLACLAQLREHVTAAKETLSSDTEASVPVILPGVMKRVRITREEFEDAIRFRILRTVDLLAGAIASAGATPGEVKTALLIGGSSRIPLVSRLIASELGIPVAVDAHPKYATCLGAAIATGVRLTAAPAAVPEASPPSPGGAAPAAQPVASSDDADHAAASATAPQPVDVDSASTEIAEQIDTTKSTSVAPTVWAPAPADPDKPAEQAGNGSARRRMLIATGAVIVALLTITAGVFAFRGGDTIAGSSVTGTQATHVASAAPTTTTTTTTTSGGATTTTAVQTPTASTTSATEQVVVNATGSPPWTVEGYGVLYSVASVARTTSERAFEKTPSITVTAYVTRTERNIGGMEYKFSDQNSSAALDEGHFEGGGDRDPPLNQRSKLVFVVWDTSPRATLLTITLHASSWPDGRDLILRDVPVS